MPDHRISRRQFLALSGAGLAAVKLAGCAWGAEAEPFKRKLEDGLAWYDVRDWGVEGRGWNDTEQYFDRLPAKAQGVVRKAVWGLSRHSAGMCARFETDAATIWARYKLRSKNLAMSHMPATGVSGLDLYAQDKQGQWRWLGVIRPSGGPAIKHQFASEIEPGYRAYTVYLPLYNGVESLEIGLPPDARFKPLPPRAKPLVFYGTSITQGGCASRPGMVYTSILGRRLDRPVINLGFSGNGKMEPELGALMAEIDAAAYVIDCLPNMNAEMVAERTGPLVHQLRKARPKTPIVLVEDRTNTNAGWLPARRQHHADNRAALKKVFNRLVAADVEGLVYVGGEQLLGNDGEAAVDGSHPSDLGMMRMADALDRVLQPVLSGK